MHLAAPDVNVGGNGPERDVGSADMEVMEGGDDGVGAFAGEDRVVVIRVAEQGEGEVGVVFLVAGFECGFGEADMLCAVQHGTCQLVQAGD